MKENTGALILNRSFNIHDSRKYRSLQSGGEKLRVQTKDSV